MHLYQLDHIAMCKKQQFGVIKIIIPAMPSISEQIVSAIHYSGRPGVSITSTISR